MQNKLVDIRWNKEVLWVYWVLTDYCNQACNYCSKSLHKGWVATGQLPGLQTDQEIDLFLDYIIDVAKKKDMLLVVSLSGGEPTTHKKYPEIVERLKPHGFVETVTNAARPLAWWESLPQLPHNIMITLHPEYYDVKEIRINELSEFFINSNVTLTYNLACDPYHWDAVIEIVNSIDNKFRHRIFPKPIFEFDISGHPMRKYTTEQVEFMKSFSTDVKYDIDYPFSTRTFSDGTTSRINANKLAAQGMNQFKGWKCSAGMKGIDVRANGIVYAGICNAQILGRISNFKLLDEYLICPKNHCPCPSDINLDKYI
jgi:sulfatase maturation enzyme AslB (radical SAM superfamily)